MTTICIQIQPDRFAGYDEAAVLSRCELLKFHRPLIAGFEMEVGDDEGPWVNLMFDTDEPARLWPILQSSFFSDDAFGNGIRHSAMAMCTGEAGWEDYLLLYHYDPNQILDTLAD